MAFRNWAFQVGRLRVMLTSAVDSSVVKAAMEAVQGAEISYRASRNRLTENMKQAQQK